MLRTEEVGKIVLSLSNWAVLNNGKLELSVHDGQINFSFARYAEKHNSSMTPADINIRGILADITSENISVGSSIEGGGRDPLIETFSVVIGRPNRRDR